MLRIHLLGQPHMVHDGQPVKIAGLPKTLPCLAYLLLHRTEAVSRETLAFALWPDDSEAHARANLRRHLHDLRHSLPVAPADRPWLLISADTVHWNPAIAYWFDVAEFERLSITTPTLAEAVTLYSGDLLANVYDDWLLYERERLHNLYIADLHTLIVDHRSRRDYATAIGYAQRLLQYEPLREDTVRQLMTARYEAGDRSGALQDYERFVHRLGEELGVDPMPETRALYESIVHNTRLPGTPPQLEPWSDEVGPPQHPLLPFVGRDVEFAQLHSWWSRAARGNGGIVLITGEAGIGKTRLVSELAQRADSEGGRILVGHTSFAEPVPYQALVAALRTALPLVNELELEPLWRAAIAAIIPELGKTHFGGAKANVRALAPLDPERERTRLFEALARCLAGLAQPRPMLLILEDLHWASTATAELIEFLAHRVHQQALLIVITYREEETARTHPLRELRRHLQSTNQMRHIPLARLPVSAIETLVAQIPALRPAEGTLSQRLYVESEGQPFFLSELIRELLETRTSGGPYELEGPGAHTTILAPRSVRALIAGRVGRLSPAAQAVAEAAAVVGDAFAVELVRGISGWDEHQVLDSLGELLDRGLVSEVTGRGHADFMFTHHLIQTTIYASLPVEQRKRRHRRVAQVMEELYAQQLDDVCSELAVHYDHGNEPQRAVKYYLQAARHANAVYADDVALHNLACALLLGPDDPTRFETVALRATIFSRRGDRQAEEADLRELAGIAQVMADEDRICDVIKRQILLQRTLGERQGEARSIVGLKARAAESGRLWWWAEALHAEAAHHVLLGQYDGACTRLAEVLSLRLMLSDAPGAAEGYALFAEVAALQGHFPEAQTMLNQARMQLGVQANQSLLVGTLRTAAVAAMTQVDIDVAYALGQQMLDLCRRIGDREGEADACTRIAAAAARLFRVQEARQYYAQAEALYEMLGNRRGQAAVLVNSGMLAANLGQYVAAIEASRRAEALFKGLQDLRGQTVSAINLAAHALRQGDYTTAKRAASRALIRARELQGPVMEAYALANLGAAERELGQFAAAIDHMQAGLAVRRTLDQPVELATDLCDLTIAYLRSGHLQAAKQTTDEMLVLLAADGPHMTYPQFILWAAAQTYRSLGQTERAATLLREAHVVLQAKVGAIPDPESRTSFLQLPYNRELVAAYEHDLWP